MIFHFVLFEAQVFCRIYIEFSKIKIKKNKNGLLPKMEEGMDEKHIFFFILPNKIIHCTVLFQFNYFI